VTPTKEDYEAIYWQTLCAGFMPNGYSETQKLYNEWYNTLQPVRQLAKTSLKKGMRGTYATLSLLGYIRKTWKSIAPFIHLCAPTNYRRLGRTKGGYLCLLPADAGVGDMIALCKGGQTPLVMRPNGGILVGEAYVHGMMNGERFDESACYDIQLK
jgi:hypothetical protein